MKVVMFAAVLPIVLAVTPGFAGESCDRWSFGMLEDEGGPAASAWVCPAASEPSLLVHCEGSDSFFISYFEGGDPPNRDPGYEGKFEITIGDDTFRRNALFQAMDASIAIPKQKITGPLVAAMMSGERMSIKPMDGSHSGDSFALAGSTAALKQLAATCGK